MARFQLSDQQIILSTAPETAVNTPYVATAGFVGARVDSQMPPLPELNRSPDGMIGDGTERSQKLRRGWWNPRQISLGGRLNTETAARLGSRNLGGTVTPTAVSAGASYDQVTICQTKGQGRIPKLTTLGFLLGGYDFLWPSMAVGKYTISFEGERDVNFVADLINTGYWKRLGDLGTPIVPPNPPTHHLMHPAATRVTFSNGSTIDFAADGNLISGSCSLDNSIVVRPLAGDPFIDPANRKSGAYARDIHRGPRVPMATLKVALDASLTAFTLAQSGADITSLTYLFRGEDKIGATSEDYEFEWKFPLAEIEAVNADTDGDDAAVTMNFYPKTDPVSGGYVIQRVRTDAATWS